MNHRGQSSIEALVSAFVVMNVTLVLIGVVYFSSLKIFIDYRAHEAMVCGAQHHPELCRLHLEKELKNILFFGSLEILRLSKSTGKVSVQILLKFSLWRGNFKWQFQDKISFPLEV